MNKVMSFISGALLTLAVISGALLTLPSTSATDTVSNISLSVPVSCNVTSTLDQAHSATINPGQYQEDIGTTTIKVFCNDNAGYALYALGFSNEEYGNTNLLPTDTTNPSIATGLATSGNTSAWAMKLAPVTTASSGTSQPYAPTIESDTAGSFTNYHVVPDVYTKVATFTSATDFTIGSSLTTTYRAYIHGLQPADTYTGKVRYALVHPNDANPPYDPRFIAQLDTGENINIKMKNLANNTSDATTSTPDSVIQAIVKASSLPTGFTPSAENTISTPTSPYPVYVFFDDTTGTMYYYSEVNNIFMNSNSCFTFYGFTALTNINDIGNWDTSTVTNMRGIFNSASSLSNIDPLSSWDTSAVTLMMGMFYNASSLTNIDGASNWDTSAVTNMSGMFYHASSLTNIDGASNWNTSAVTNMGGTFQGASSLTNIDALSSWDTSAVTKMGSMFPSTKIANIDALSSWDTSAVTDMSYMFYNATSLTNIDGASNWHTSAVTNMSGMFSGATSLTNIDGTSNWDTSAVTGMEEMFYNASSLTNIDGASNWNTSAVTDMTRMFFGTKITNLDALSNWNTSAVTIMMGMFYSVSSLTNIDGASNWNTSALTNINNMFNKVNNIDATVLNGWNVANVTSKSNAFTCPTAMRPCWYNNTTCPSSNSGNSSNSPSSNQSTLNTTNNNSIVYLDSPDSDSVSSQSATDHTADQDLEYTSPQGETYRGYQKFHHSWLLLIILTVLFFFSLTTGIYLFISAARKDDEDEA